MLDRPDDKPGPEPKGEPLWSFPSRPRCHVCYSLDTRATSTQGRTQYRVCKSCGRTFKVLGTEA